MRCISVVNQKGGVGKTTTVVNLGAALARAGQRVVIVDLDPQAHMSLHVGLLEGAEKGGARRPAPSTYHLLCGGAELADTLQPTATEGLTAIPADFDLSGAELELAAEPGRETILRGALETWVAERAAADGREPADFVLFDCPPSLGLLSLNGLVASGEVLVALQPEFFALQGLSRLVEVVRLVRRRLNPDLRVSGILPCRFDSRLRLAREVLAEIQDHFPDELFRQSIASNVKLAEAPSFGVTIFDYAPDSRGAQDYQALATEVLERGGATREIPRVGTTPAQAAAGAGCGSDPTPSGPAQEPCQAAAAVPDDAMAGVGSPAPVLPVPPTPEAPEASSAPDGLGWGGLLDA